MTDAGLDSQASSHTETATPVIDVKGLVKVFGSHPEKAIDLLNQGKTKQEIYDQTKQSIGVAKASFDVYRGEILVIMGLSGSGKSTLVRCLNRLINPTAGEIRIDGQLINDLPASELRQLRQKKFGMVFQNFALFPHRTVGDNAEYGLEIQGVTKPERREIALQVLEQVGLKGWEDAYPRQLSGGMQQRVGLARALALDPDILLMDEAFSALDPLIRRDMQDELLELQARMQKTIVFISHDLDEALKLGDRIVLMKDGAVVQIGTPEEILINPANRYVEKFVEDVDISKVITAETIMKKCRTIGHLRNDGPRSALRKMDQADISRLFVLRKDSTLQGIVTAEDAAEAAKRGEKNLEQIIERNISTVEETTPINELFDLLKDLPYPLPVVTQDYKLRGIISRSGLITALADRGGSASS